MNISDYLSQLQTLTQKNLDILKVINDSFYTKSEHITTNIDGTSYVIPSFLSLENKINALQDNFNNLVNAPLTGEAYFNFDGNSQSIEMRGFNCAPDKLKLDIPTYFDVESNDIFKDFLTPNPYVNFNLTSLPNDVTTINVKKVIPSSDEMKSIFASFFAEGENVVSKSWADVKKILEFKTEDVDYIEYDTLKTLPARQPNGFAQYVISKIISDEIDANLDEIITIKLRSDFAGVSDGEIYTKDLTYTLFDGTIAKNLKVGDQLVTFNNSTKLEITELRPVTNTIIVKVLNGEYLNLIESNGNNIEDLSKLKLFSEANFDDTKYVHVSLEEDEYVFIAIAALNSKLRVQSPWGDGVIIKTSSLTKRDDASSTFAQYYKENVRNIGDVLYEMTSMMNNTLTKYSKDQFVSITNYKPMIQTDGEHIIVSRINKHLDDSETIQNIKKLYSQKKQYESQLTEVQNEIYHINEDLSSISFDDTSGQRSALTASLSADNKRKNELTTSLAKIMNDISHEANNSDVPIENAKYRIRGYYDYSTISVNNMTDNDAINKHVCGIEVWYRYKNANKMQGNAESIGNFIFSDWNIMNSFDLPKIASMSGDVYRFNMEPNNDNVNEPSFNQIDIPISRGETVDIKLRLIYDYGKPFVTVRSAWSDIVNIPFPEEYEKDVQILDIITENNNEIETNRFENILAEQGIPAHIEDRIMDQDITYYHKPESIASGFYTSERRIIPLKDKLAELNNTIQMLTDEINGTNSNAISASIIIGESETVLAENVINNISIASPADITDDSTYLTDGVYEKDGNKISTVLQLTLTNKSSHAVKLFPIFPGPRDKVINNYPYNDSWTNYAENYGGSGATDCGVWAYLPADSDKPLYLQTLNQYITFRLNDPWTKQSYYQGGKQFTAKNVLSYDSGYVVLNNEIGASMYPILNNKTSLCVESDSTNEYLLLNPEDSIVIPIMFEYNLGDNAELSKIMSFDVRTSLYRDPINFTFKALVKSESTPQDKLINTIKKRNPYIKYNPTVKA